MKILLSTLFSNNPPFRAFFDHLCSWTVSHFRNRADVKFLMTFDLYQQAIDSHLVDDYELIPVSQEDVKYIFGLDGLDIKDVKNQVSCNNPTPIQINRLKDVAKQKLSDWKPDIILSLGHVNGARLWENIFPNALTLSTDNAIFSRPPLKRTLSYDPYTMNPDTFLSRFADDIKSFKITKEQNNQVEKLKKSLTGIVDKYSPLDDAMVYYYKQKFDKLVLLPLVSDYIVKLFGDCICDNEFDLVESVMKNTPQNIGVFVTQHDSAGSLSPENIKYFQSTYPNFIFLQQTNVRGFANNSLNYFQYVDAVLNITSKAGYMAMIWDKPVISLAKNYNLWYQDGAGIEDLERVLNTPYKNKNNVLYWYFTHYVVFFQDFGREDFLYNFLNNLLENFRNNGINFDFYPQINDFDKIFDYVLPNAIDFYQNKNQKQIMEIEAKINKHESDLKSLRDNFVMIESKSEKIGAEINKIIKMKWYKKLFSVSRDENYRFVRLFGMKFNVRRLKHEK